MENEPLLNRLSEIRKSLESFQDTLEKVRYDEFKQAVEEQIVSIFEASSVFSTVGPGSEPTSPCKSFPECRDRMLGIRDDALAAFRRDDVDGSMLMLEEAEAELSRKGSPCADKGCAQKTSEAIQKVKVLLSIAENLMFRNYIQPETSYMRLTAYGKLLNPRLQGHAEVPAAELSKLLEPLANPYRIQVLRLLARENRSFSEISRAVNLRTGHLQFHLKVLKDAGYIRSNRRKRDYAITSKGLGALDSIESFVERLQNHMS